MLVVALVLSRLDYGNATQVGLPANLLNCLQSVLNAAVRSVAGLRRSDHITDTLASFHWLRAPEHIKFKLAVTVYQAVHGTAPRYLSDLYTALLTSHQDAVSSRRPPLNWSSLCRGLEPSVIDHLLLPAPGSETLCFRTLHLRRLYWCSDEN